MEKIRVLHIITDTDIGGAERMLEKLLQFSDMDRFEPEVLSLLPVDAVGRAIQAMGVPVETAGMSSGLPSLRQLLRVYKWIKVRKPSIVQTWMYHADLIGGVAARCAGTPVVWGIHQSNLNPRVNSSNTMLSARLGKLLSGTVPHSIVCCSFASAESHTAFGYNSEKMRIIHNGFEVPPIIPRTQRYLRGELGIKENSFVVGMVARFDPQKDHGTFIKAARRLYEKHRKVQFILCGEDVDRSNTVLLEMIRRYSDTGFENSVHLIGRRGDMEQVYAAMDILGTSSVGEGLPLVVGEAMARGIPCVVTDVGDSAHVVGETGIVVPAEDSKKLSEAWSFMYQLTDSELLERGKAARLRIENELNIKTAVKKYHDLYTSILEGNSMKCCNNQ